MSVLSQNQLVVVLLPAVLFVLEPLLAGTVVGGGGGAGGGAAGAEATVGAADRSVSAAAGVSLSNPWYACAATANAAPIPTSTKSTLRVTKAQMIWNVNARYRVH